MAAHQAPAACERGPHAETVELDQRPGEGEPRERDDPGNHEQDEADCDPEAEQEVDGYQPPVGERAGEAQERRSAAGWGAGDQHRDRAAVEHLTEEDGDRLRQDGDQDRDRGQVRDAVHAVDVDRLVRDGVEQPERDEHDGADQ